MKRLLLFFGILLGWCGHAQLVAPFTESFDLTSIPTGWTNTSTNTSANANWKFTGTPGNPSMSGTAYNPPVILDHTQNGGSIAWSDGSTPVVSDCGLLTDSIDASALTNLFLEFYFYSNNVTNAGDNNTLYVNFYDGTQWNDSIWGYAGDGTVWQYAGLDLSSYTISGKIMFEFVVDQTTATTAFYNDILLDDISVTNVPTCPKPQSLAVHTITSSSVVFDWAAVTAASSGYEVIYGPSGFDPQTSGTSANASSDSLLVTGLSGATTYDFYVRANCGAANGFSDTVGPVSATTTCVPFSGTYTTDFDSDTDGSVALCWEQYSSYGTAAYARVENLGTPRSGTQQLAMYSSGASATNDTLLAVSPQFSDLTAGNKQLNFWTKTSSASNSLIVGTLSSNTVGATFTPVDTIVFSGTNTYQEVIIPFNTANGYNGTDEYIGFVHSLGATFSYIYIDDFTYEVIPPCPKLAGASITNIGITTADITFSGSADSVQYEYGPVGFTQGTGTLTSLGSAPYTITGLNAQTCYDVYVRNNCTANSNGYSTWDGPFTFCTLCTTVSLPFSEDFDIGLGCFSAVDGGTSIDTWEHTPAGGNGNYSGDLDGTGHASVDSDAPGSGPTLYEELVSPYIDASNIQGTLYLEFDQYYNHLSSSAEVEVWDGNAWVNLLTQNTADVGSFTTPDHQQIDITSYANDSLQVRFVYDDQGSWAWYWLIDNVLIHDVVCPQPTALKAFNQGMTSADLTWTTGGASNWIVEYGLAGFTLGTGTVVNASNDTITLSGLTSSTAYEFYVRDSCATGGLSNWTGPHQFATSLCAVSQQCDFIFDLYDTFGDGWNGAEITVRQNGIDVAQLGSNFTTGSSLTGLVVSLCDGLPTEVVLTTAGGWPGEIEFDVYNSGQLVAQHTAATVSQGDTLANFTASCPTCPSPTNRTLTALNDTSATISWTNFSGSNQTEVWFGPTGFYQGSQTMAGTKFLVSGDTAVMDTLSSNSCYDVYLRSICAAGDSGAWVGPLSFCTPCVPITAPFTEDFENHTLGYFQGDDNCWTIQNTAVLSSNTNGYSWELRNAVQTTSGGTGADRDATLFPATGGQFFNADVSYGSAGDSSMLISPIIDISGLNNPELEYNIHRYGSNMAEFYVDIFDGTQWVNGVHSYTSLTGAQTSNAAAWTDTTISLSAYAGITNFQVRFRTVSNGCCPGDNGLDQVRISDPVTCPAPTSLNVSNISSTSSDVSFTAGTGTTNNFQVSYGPSISSPAAGTIVSQSSANFTLSGLTAGTNYCVYVRDICSAGDTSAWTGPVCFNTICATVQLPYSEDFNSSLGCFSAIDGGTSTDTWVFTPAGGNGNYSGDLDGTGHASVDSDDAGTGATLNEELVSPYIDASNVRGALYLEFDQYYNHLGSSATVDVYDGSTWNNVLTQNTADVGAFGAPDHQKIDITAYANDSLRIRFVYNDLGAWAWYWLVDNVLVYKEACPNQLTNLSTANHGCDSIELNWTSATGGSIIEYGPAGFTPGNGTFTGVVTSPYSVTGLSAGNSYTFRIADTCGTDTSTYNSITDTTVSGPLPVAAFSIDSAFVNGEYVVYVNALASQNADTYQWIYSNKTDFGIVDTNSFTSNGPQTITLVVTNGCGSDTATFTTYANIGLYDVNAPENLRVYPNPTSDVLFISFMRANAEEVEINLIDAQGRVVEKLADKAQGQQYETKLSLSHLATGVYMLEIRTGEKVSKQRIVVKH